MWGPEDVIAMSDLSAEEGKVLLSAIVPELKDLPDPVEPTDRPTVQRRLAEIASIAD